MTTPSSPARRASAGARLGRWGLNWAARTHRLSSLPRACRLPHRRVGRAAAPRGRRGAAALGFRDGLADTAKQGRIAEEHERPNSHAVLAPVLPLVHLDLAQRCVPLAVDDAAPTVALL